MRLHLDTPANSAAAHAGEANQTAAVTAGREGAGPARGNSGGDSIQLSGPSAILNRMSVDRAQRVQQLAAAVQSGSYDVSASRISNAIVGHALASYSHANTGSH